MKRLMKRYGLRKIGGKRKGFTLIELLIVLTILAILVAVVTISLTTFVGKGKAEACKADGKSLQTAVIAFYSEAQVWPQTASDDDTIDYGAGDGATIEKFFEPDYVLAAPESQTLPDGGCNWSVSDDGVVYADPDGPLPADKDDRCACWADYPVP